MIPIIQQTHDIWQSKAERRRESLNWQKVRNAEHSYAIQLRKIARHVGEIIKHFPIGDPTVVPEVTNLLSRYADIILPWAKATGARMIAEVDRRDYQAWKRASQKLSRDLHKEVRDAPIGEVVRKLQEDQVLLITSLPLEAAQRIQTLTQQYVMGGRRYDELVPMIMNTPGVTLSRATLIARTEVAKASSSLVQARAQHIGSEGYIWRSVQDIYVRKMHRKLNGSVQSWANPPIAEENGDKHHPGNFPNCFTGETLAGPIESCVNVFRAFYSGPLVTLKIGETTVRVTPNHPILTPRGWIASGLLQTGDYVIKPITQCGDSVKPDVNNGFATFEEIFELFSSRAPRRTLFVDNFYGDVIQHDVDIVSTKQNLSLNREAASFEFISDDMVANTNSGIIGALIEGFVTQIVETSLSRFLDTLRMLFGGLVLGDALVHVGLGSHWDVLADQKFMQPTTRNTELHTKINFPFSSQISRDNFGFLGFRQDKRFLPRVVVTSVEKSAFDGHVYTLETDRGYYSIASTMIAKNCRCFAEPIIPDVIE